MYSSDDYNMEWVMYIRDDGNYGDYGDCDVWVYTIYVCMCIDLWLKRVNLGYMHVMKKDILIS